MKSITPLMLPSRAPVLMTGAQLFEVHERLPRPEGLDLPVESG